ncbi:alpha/beta-hydrolase [Clavulina sp. PMI_390]|nr:alpha/beta-hydrolase [Clavulina sp. PMI_390]
MTASEISRAEAEAFAKQEEDEARRLVGLKTLFDPNTLVKKGLCPVSKIKGETPLTSHSLYYEQHGKGPQKIVYIMGLNNTCFAWETQVKHFTKDPKYSMVVFDNRGVGNSDAPRGPYSTSEMASDAITLADYLGWTSERQLHIVGISLGGMIALELATMIPQRIASLSLIVTTPGNVPRPFANLPPFKGAHTLLRLLTIKEPVDKVPYVLGMIYPEPWLEETPENGGGLTNRQLQEKVRSHPRNHPFLHLICSLLTCPLVCAYLPDHGHKQIYFRRIDHTRPQTLVGSLSQMAAALTHYVSPSRLAAIDASIPKIAILTGDSDHMVSPAHSQRLAQYMPHAQFEVWQRTGHALPMQWPERAAAWFEKVFEEGWERSVAQMRAVAPAGTTMSAGTINGSA